MKNLLFRGNSKTKVTQILEHFFSPLEAYFAGYINQYYQKTRLRGEKKSSKEEWLGFCYYLFKLKIFFLSLVAISSTLSATQESCSELTQETSPCYFSQPLFEVKTGYFFFSNPTMRKVYNEGGFDIQLCTSYPLWNLTHRWTLNGYVALEFFHLCGKSIHGDEKTSLWSVPLNIGLKPVYAINANLRYYFAIGPRPFYVHQHNLSSFVYKNKSKMGLGFFVNTGFNYLLGDHFIIDIFGEYSYAKVHFHGGNPEVYTRNIQIGGFTFGGGLGYIF